MPLDQVRSERLKKAFLIALAFSLLAHGSFAQDTPKADVALGYSYLHLNGSSGVSGINSNGISGSIAYNVSGLVGLVADFGVDHGSVSGAGVTASSYMLGPRFSVRSNDKFTPFVQALFGGGHVNSATAGPTTVFHGLNAFAFSLGGGTDFGIAKNGKVALRPQFDSIGLHDAFCTTNPERISAGIVFNFGQKHGRRE